MGENKKTTTNILEEDFYEEDGIYYVDFNAYDQPIIPKAHMKLVPSEEEIELIIEKEMKKRGKL